MARPTTRTDSSESLDESSAGILIRIRSALPSLAPAEQRVAQAVLGDPAQASRWSIGILADREFVHLALKVTQLVLKLRTCGLGGNLTSYVDRPGQQVAR